MRNSKRMWWIHVCRGTARAVGCGVGTSKIVSHDCSQDVEPIQLVGVGVGVGVGAGVWVGVGLGLGMGAMVTSV